MRREIEGGGDKRVGIGIIVFVLERKGPVGCAGESLPRLPFGLQNSASLPLPTTPNSRSPSPARTGSAASAQGCGKVLPIPHTLSQ